MSRPPISPDIERAQEDWEQPDDVPQGVDPAVLARIDLYTLDAEVLKLERAYCCETLFFLAHDILGYRDIDNPWNRQFCWQLDTTMHILRRMWLLPRGTFKTTLGTISDSIRIILCMPDIPLAIMSADAENAQLMLKEIKWHHMYNRRFRRLFPDFAPPRGNWGTKSECTVPARKAVVREGSYNAIGVEEHVTSKHFFHFKKDDCQDEQNATTIEQLDALDRWDKRTRALGYPVKEAHHDYIGTRWAVKDLYARAMKRIRNLYLVVRDAERGPNGEKDQLLIPSVLPQETLDDLKFEMRSSYYRSQYRLKPHDPETANFKEEDLNLCRTDAILSPDEANFAVIMDPGFKKQGTSETAIVVMGADVFGEPWIVDGIAGKFGVRQAAGHLFDLGKKWKAVYPGLFIEQITNEAVAEELEYLIADSSFKPKVTIISSQDRSKDMRILRAQPWVERHALHLCNRCPIVDRIIDQYSEDPNGLRDITDAISTGLDHALPKMVEQVDPPEPAHVRYINECMSDNPNPYVVATFGYGDEVPFRQFDRRLAAEVVQKRGGWN